MCRLHGSLAAERVQVRARQSVARSPPRCRGSFPPLGTRSRRRRLRRREIAHTMDRSATPCRSAGRPTMANKVVRGRKARYRRHLPSFHASLSSSFSFPLFFFAFCASSESVYVCIYLYLSAGFLSFSASSSSPSSHLENLFSSLSLSRSFIMRSFMRSYLSLLPPLLLPDGDTYFCFLLLQYLHVLSRTCFCPDFSRIS